MNQTRQQKLTHPPFFKPITFCLFIKAKGRRNNQIVLIIFVCKSRMETTAAVVVERQQQQKQKRKVFLAAVDESEESLHALSWFLNNILPTDTPTTLVLVYAKPPPPLYFAPDGSGYMFSAELMATMNKYKADVAECVVEKAKRVCREAVNNDKVKVETMIERGDARDVICQVAEKLCVDLLVMGSRGYGPIKRAFLGSVSNHCAQNVKCPILIIKTPKINSNS
ncbi:Universal stress protein A-like protein [Linum perenne]